MLRTGHVFVELAPTRDTASWLHFLDGVKGFAPPGEVYLIADGLPLHWSIETILWNWGHPCFHFVPLPKAAAVLTLLERFWKILRQRAWAGGSPPPSAEVVKGPEADVADWNRQRTPCLW